ncbi:MAG: TetR family transcriptional regulator [Bdellovibrionaceae bacterium]|nr:TetR family transcriptional regulator [Pseudobdellovibrionaceae bacterium]NUM58694.1 TetR family transcriptional regulator [Pseudobdellovibrionaceae bacterium]
MTPKEELSTRELIKAKALKLFAEKGIDGVSVREIAKETGQNISQISYYFESKEGLYRTIIKDHSQVISQKIHDVILNLKDEKLTPSHFEAEMKKFIAIFVDMRLQNPHISRIMQRETLDGMPFVKDIHNETIKPLVGLIESIMEKSQKMNIVKKDVPVRVFFILLTESIWGFMAKKECKWDLMAKTCNFPKDRDLFIENVYNIFFKGILK